MSVALFVSKIYQSLHYKWDLAIPVFHEFGSSDTFSSYIYATTSRQAYKYIPAPDELLYCIETAKILTGCILIFQLPDK